MQPHQAGHLAGGADGEACEDHAIPGSKETE